MLRLDGLTKRFNEYGVFDISLQLRPGEILAVVGPSGSGKSTLLNLVAGLLEPDSGRVFLDGIDVTALAPERRGLGYVFQDHVLWPHLTVDNHLRLVAPRMAEAMRSNLLKQIGLHAFAGSLPSQLSGGQRQRVALARALAVAPRVVLFDEPYSALDPVLREDLRLEVASLVRSRGVSALHVTHDPDEALAIADTVLVLERGRMMQVGAPQAVYQAPLTLASARAFGNVNVVPATLAGNVVCWAGREWPAVGYGVGYGPVMLAIRYDDLQPCAHDADGVIAVVVARYPLRGGPLLRVRGPFGELLVQADAPPGTTLKLAPRAPLRAFAAAD